MRSCIDSLHELSVERCRIVHESLASNIQVEDHHHLLQQVRILFNQAEIDASSILHQYEHRLHRLSADTLRGIVHQLLSDLGADGSTTPFHNDINRKHAGMWRPLTLEVAQRRDQATIRRHQQTKMNKRRREEFEDMVESKWNTRRRCN